MVYIDKGYIGCFEMAGKEAGKRQLAEYIRQLKQAGHRRIVAPINGDTWHQYRLVSWSNGDAAFAMEPQNPLWYNEVYEELGFRPLMKYRSDKFSIAHLDNAGGLRVGARNDEFDIRGFRDGDLRLIYDISLSGFDNNFLYNEISFEEFAALYQPILPIIDSDLVLIAEIDGQPAAFLFSFIVGDMLILKSMAVLPQFRSHGIGARLIDHAVLAGHRRGAKTAIAALMSDGNNSNKIISKYGGEKIREYTLYSLEV